MLDVLSRSGGSWGANRAARGSVIFGLSWAFFSFRLSCVFDLASVTENGQKFGKFE